MGNIKEKRRCTIYLKWHFYIGTWGQVLCVYSSFTLLCSKYSHTHTGRICVALCKRDMFHDMDTFEYIYIYM